MPNGALVCPQCGTRQESTTQSFNNVPQSAPGAIAGFIVSLIGFLLGWLPLAGLAISIVGTVICSKGKKEMNANPGIYTNKGLLSAGYIIGIIGIIGGAIYLLITAISALILGGSFFSILDFASQMSQY